MAKDLEALARRLDAISEQLTKQITGLVQSVIGGIADEIVPKTPVDTGFARANWRPSIAAPSITPISFLDPSGEATRSRIKVEATQWRPGDVFFIVNRAPYIGALNEGSSPQAPRGFVEKAVVDGVKAGLAAFPFSLET